MLPAEAWGHLIGLGHQGSVASSRFFAYLQVCSLWLMAWGFFLGIDSRKAETHSSTPQAEDGTVSVCLLKYPGLFGL